MKKLELKKVKVSKLNYLEENEQVFTHPKLCGDIDLRYHSCRNCK